MAGNHSLSLARFSLLDNFFERGEQSTQSIIFSAVIERRQATMMRARTSIYCEPYIPTFSHNLKVFLRI